MDELSKRQPYHSQICVGQHRFGSSYPGTDPVHLGYPVGLQPDFLGTPITVQPGPANGAIGHSPTFNMSTSVKSLPSVSLKHSTRP